MKKTVCTLCLLVCDGKILLGMKKVGFGTGKYNGFGGKVKNGETIEKGAIREMKEECGLEIEGLQKVGILRFFYPERKPAKEIETHIFKIGKHAGVLTESGEMKPEWFNLTEIPYDQMWPDDRQWLPLLLEGKSFSGNFHFGKKEDIIQHELVITKEAKTV